MKKLILPRRSVILGGAAAICAPTIVRAGFLQGKIGDNQGFSSAPVGSSAYSGPGDIVSGADIWWGLFAYNAAYATGSNAGVDLVDQAGANLITINILSNGKLDTASISAWVTAHTVSTILVTKIYDQTGNARHGIQATLASMPTLVLNSIGTLPAIVATGSKFLTYSGTFPTVAQPWSSACMAEAASNAATQGIWSEGVAGINFVCSTTNFRLDAGSLFNGAAADTAAHAILAIGNGASSVITVDASDLTGNGGTRVPSTSPSFSICSTGADTLNGKIGEWGFWPSGFTTQNRTDLVSNIKTRWGI